MISDHNSARVFLLESPRRTGVNVDPAREFGTLQIVFVGQTDKGDVYESATYQERIVERFIELGFSPEIDSLCIFGGAIDLVTAVAALVSSHGFLNVLLFDAHAGCYVPERLGNMEAVTHLTQGVSKDASIDKEAR